MQQKTVKDLTNKQLLCYLRCYGKKYYLALGELLKRAGICLKG